MGQRVADSKLPVLISLVFVLAGCSIAAIHGILHGSIGGGIVAAIGALPGLAGMWKGIQQETQSTLALSVGMVIVSLAVGAVLIVLGIVNWVA